MDRSFNNSLFGSSKTTGISRSRQSLGGSLFSSSSKKGGLPASKKGSGWVAIPLNIFFNYSNIQLISRYSLSTKSNLSSLQIVARSEYNIVECYGLPLPVQVSEILTFSDKSAHVSLNYSANGWAWAVCGRKLLVWQYKESVKTAENYQQQSSRRAITSQCRLLTLPHCDIGHKATLISVFIADDHQMASCKYAANIIKHFSLKASPFHFRFGGFADRGRSLLAIDCAWWLINWRIQHSGWSGVWRNC